MKKSFGKALIVAIVATLAIATFAFAGPGRHSQMRPGHGAMGIGPLGHLQQMQARLGLSDGQVAQIKAIFAETREQNATQRQQLHNGMGAAFQLLVQNPADVAGAQKALDQQLAAERALKSNMIAATAKALNVLTAGQRAELAKIMAERGARRQGRRQ